MTGRSGPGPRALGDLLKSGPAGEPAPANPLGALARAAESRLALTEEIRRQLPPDLAGGVDACNLRPDGTLVVTATSPDWAARLRFEAEGMLASCRAGWPAATRVRVRVGTGP
jgi:hypothetical protein